MTHNQYLTVKETADVLGVDAGTVYKYVHNGAPVHYWGSCHYRIVLDELLEWMDAFGRVRKHKDGRLAANVQQKPTAESLAERRKQLMEAIK